MNDGQCLLNAIVAHPDDDTPRLVYADWLEEHGDPDRAEFIRLQCEYARVGPHAPGARALAGRADELWAEHGHWWLPRRGPRIDSCRCRRGFPEYVSIPAGGFLYRGGRLFEAAPITSLVLNDLGDRMARVARSPLLNRLRSLTVCDDEAERGIGERIGPLFDSRHVDGLSRLSFCWGRIGAAAAAGLAGSARLAGLRVLDLRGCDLGDEGVETLLAAPWAPNLTSLALDDNGVTDAGVRALAAAPRLRGLRELSLVDNRVTDAGARALAGSTTLGSLRYLDVFGNEIGDTGVAALGGLPARVTTLVLHGHPSASEALIDATERRPPAEEPAWQSDLFDPVGTAPAV
jgi:uncharacterized protein (TIGR02996 family)